MVFEGVPYESFLSTVEEWHYAAGGAATGYTLARAIHDYSNRRLRKQVGEVEEDLEELKELLEKE